MNLLELQRRMAEDVRRPLTEDYEMQSVADDGRPIADIAASYISPNNRLTSFERLEIYNRQYWFRLITAVSEDYPTLNAVLGPKRFDALVLAYLSEHTSTSWTLRDLGAKLPAFLDAHPEFGGRRHRLAVDVANLEVAYVDAFDGKQLDPLTAEEAQTIGAESRLFLQPHLRLLELAYPVDNLVLAVKKETPEVDIVSNAATQRDATDCAKIPSIKREAVFLAVHRYDDSVYYRRLEKETFLLLRGLRSGASVAVAASQAFAKSKLPPDVQASLLQEGFAHASQLGWLCPLNEASLELAGLRDVGQKEEASVSEELEPRNGDITRAYVLLRVTLGLSICLHGLVRWTKGLHSFAESLVPLFAKTPMPPWSVFDFGYVLPILEALVGAAVLFGLQTRRALQAGSILMLVLMFGSSLREDWPTVGIQLTYSVVYCILIAGVRFDGFGVDRLKKSSL